MTIKNTQQLKLLFELQLFAEQTDDNHGITVCQIISHLKTKGIRAERKTIYTDIKLLRAVGLDIISKRDGRQHLYYLGKRRFELAELKLLVDSVQASRLITQKKSDELINRLESLASVHEAKQLHRQVILAGRVKSLNESVYYNVDAIHSAITNNVQIQFQYCQWTLEKTMLPRHDGLIYCVSPLALLWNNENYYLIAYSAEEGRTKHFRVDKMLHIFCTEDAREKTTLESFNLPNYANSMFEMFNAEPVDVTLLCDNDKAGAIIDRFGTEIPFTIVDEEHFETTVNVAVSNLFLGWVLGVGGGVHITEPSFAVDEMRKLLRSAAAQYL